MGKIKRIFDYIPIWSAALLLLAALSLAVLAVADRSTSVADALNGSIGAVLRAALAAVSSVLPASIFECLILLALPTLVYLVVLAVRCSDARARVRGVAALLAVISTLYSSFVFTLGVGYHTTPLADRLGLDTDDGVSLEALYSTALTVRDRVNALAEGVELTDGESRLEYGMDELSEKILLAYAAISEKYGTHTDFYSRAKPISYSGIMADMGITGIYSYFTGEANVNTAYPDYNLPFTVAHEMAHQRGFSRENEANFMAFLVCEASGDPYIRYSGYLNLYEYLRSALYSTDEGAFSEVDSGLSDIARADMRASSEVARSHSDSPLNKLMDRVNDGYLKANGTEGVVSYSYVTRLAVAYFT